MKKFIKILCVMSIMTIIFSCGKKEVQVGSKTFDTSKTYTIAISQSAEKKTLDDMRKGLVIGLKNLGLLEDVNLTYTYENAKDNMSFAEQIADAYSKNDADVIVTIGEKSTVAMSNKIKDRPIVFVGVGNAERLSYADGNGIPKENVTGVIDSHLIEERLEFIQDNYENVKKLGIIYNANDNLAKYDVDYFKFDATAYNIDIYTVSVTKDEDIDKAIDTILPKVDAIALVTDFMVDNHIVDIVKKVNAAGKIVFGDTEEHKNLGAIVATSRDYLLVGEKAAELVKSILVDNKKVNELAIEKVDFKIN